MKQELFKIGKTIIFNAGKYMPKALIGISAGATFGAIGLAIEAGMEFQRLKDEGVELTWKDYGRIFGPCLLAGVFAVACAFAGLTESEKRYAAAAALASVYESKGQDFETKAREIFGDKEVNKMHEEIVKDKLDNAPEPMPVYDGTAFLDLITGQYIYRDYESIRACVNKFNERINDGYSVTKAEWCDIFNELSSSSDEELGWDNNLTGNIKINPIFHTLASGRKVAAIEVTEPKLFYETDSDGYLNSRLAGWSEV